MAKSNNQAGSSSFKDSEKMKKKIEEDLEKQKEEARKKAEDILTEVKENGNFEELAKKYSEDHSNAGIGGDLGYFSRGGMIKEFEDVAFSLNVGEISDVVESKHGYHIIKITDKKRTCSCFTADGKRRDSRE